MLRSLKDGFFQQEVMWKYHIKWSTLGTYVKNEVYILEAYETPQKKGEALHCCTSPSWGRTSEMDNKFSWCTTTARWTTDMWSRRKVRLICLCKGLAFRSICGERARTNNSSKVGRHCWLWTICGLQCRWKLFFFKVMPDKTTTPKRDPCVRGKRSEERVTVRAPSNMAGTAHLLFLITRKAQCPRCFKLWSSPPMEYKPNQEAWMMSEIFRGWVQQLEWPFHTKKGNIIMLVDNRSVHCDLPSLEWVKQLLFPHCHCYPTPHTMDTKNKLPVETNVRRCHYYCTLLWRIPPMPYLPSRTSMLAPKVHVPKNSSRVGGILLFACKHWWSGQLLISFWINEFTPKNANSFFHMH